MAVTCPADLDSVEGLFDFFVWICLGLTMHSLFRLIYKHTKRDDYSAVSSIAMFLPNEQLYHLLTFFMMMLGCYANWRVYTCEDWDANGVGHALFFFWTLALGMTHLGWITYDMTIFGAIMFFVSVLLAICNIVFAWPHDFFAVVIHFVLCGLGFVLCVLHLYIYANRKNYQKQVKIFREFWEKNKKKRLERDMDAAQQDETPESQPLVLEDSVGVKGTTDGQIPSESRMRQRAVNSKKPEESDMFPSVVDK